ncbi:hypothetical protein [Compostibacter hankyongensis]
MCILRQKQGRRCLKQILIPLACLFFRFAGAQDLEAQLAAAAKLEAAGKETEALQQYREILQQDSTHPEALSHASILCSLEGSRQTGKAETPYFRAAQQYAAAALRQNPDQTTANLAMAMALDRLASVSGVKEKVTYLRDEKKYADLALKIDPQNAQAWYILGAWNIRIGNMNFAEKAAAKMLFGGLPKGSLQEAIQDFEQCRKLDPAFIRNYYALASAYHAAEDDLKAISTLQQGLRLRSIRQDDNRIKQDCRKLLEQLQ